VVDFVSDRGVGTSVIQTTFAERKVG